MTKADKGVAPARAGAEPVVTSTNSGCSVGLVDTPEHILVRNTLSEYLDDTLEAGLRQRVDTHLRSCRDCSAYLGTLRETVGVLQRLPTPKAPPARVARIRQLAREEEAREQARLEATNSANA